MKLKVKLDHDEIEKLYVKKTKENIDMCIRYDDDIARLKAYLYVLSDNLYYGDFLEYVKGKDLTEHCQEIIQNYETF